MERPEDRIILDCQKGALEKFEELYNSYVEPIYNYLYFRTYHRETAEDLTSQSFLKALGNINKFNPGKGSFSAWLYRIARNTLYDYYRTKKNITDIDEIFDLAKSDNLEHDLDNREQLRAIEKYLDTLKPEQREIIIMRVWDELTYQEISHILGKSEASCKMMYSRAISKLRQEMPVSVFITFLLSKYLLSK